MAYSLIPSNNGITMRTAVTFLQLVRNHLFFALWCHGEGQGVHLEKKGADMPSQASTIIPDMDQMCFSSIVSIRSIILMEVTIMNLLKIMKLECEWSQMV
jgi:hypothetical protein